MRGPCPSRPVVEALWVLAGGAALFSLAAGLERGFELGPVSGAWLEEVGKTLLLLGFGLLGNRRAMPERARALGIARGLSLGLVAVSVFVLIENLAYFAAFPEAGILSRLLWSTPGHLVAALLEALGLLALLRRERFGPLRAGAALVLAGAWHTGLNLLASGPLAGSQFLVGSLVALIAFVSLLFLFLGQAYIGGFLHGAD